MVEHIDFFTSFGHGEGGDHRQRLGITTKGPTLLITDRPRHSVLPPAMEPPGCRRAGHTGRQ